MIAFLTLSLLIWLAYAFWFRQNQVRLIFRGSQTVTPLADTGLTDFAPVWAETSDSFTLEGWYRPAAGLTKPTVLFLPGRYGHPLDRADRARLMADAGYGVLLAAYRGYAGNQGEPSETGLLTDARGWADFLVKRGLSGRQLVIYGEELGCHPAAMLASERSINSLVLEAPFPDMAALLVSRYPLLPLRGGLLRHHFDLRPLLPLVRAPILVLHGGSDRLVPSALSKGLERLSHLPPRSFRPAGVSHDDLIAQGGGDALLAFLAGDNSAPLPPTLDQRPAGGRALALRP